MGVLQYTVLLHQDWAFTQRLFVGIVPFFFGATALEEVLAIHLPKYEIPLYQHCWRTGNLCFAIMSSDIYLQNLARLTIQRLNSGSQTADPLRTPVRMQFFAFWPAALYTTRI